VNMTTLTGVSHGCSFQNMVRGFGSHEVCASGRMPGSIVWLETKLSFLISRLENVSVHLRGCPG